LNTSNNSESDIKTYLKSIAKGTGVQIAGNIGAKLFTFISAVIIIRYLTTDQWGIISLSFALIEIALIIFDLGLPRGVARYIALYREKRESKKIYGTIISSLVITTAAGLIAFVLLTKLSANIANYVKSVKLSTELTSVLVLMAIIVPTKNLIKNLAAIFQGFEKVEINAIFDKILYALAKLAILGVFLIIGLSFKRVIFAYIASPFIVLIALIFYTRYKIPQYVRYEGLSFCTSELIKFSFPLLATALITVLMQRTDVIMIGHFLTEREVGLYSAVSRLNEFLLFIPVSASIIYLPIATRLLAKKEDNVLRKIFSSLAKWCFVISIPIVLIFLVYPHFAIPFFFGSKYAPAVSVLQILTIGLLVHVLIGLNGTTVIAGGKTWFTSVNSMAALVINIILNYFLIPRFGINGAAVATSISYILINIIFYFEVYYLWKIQPFTRSLVKVLAGSSILVVSLYYIFNLSSFAPIHKIILSIAAFSFFFITFLFFIKWLEDEDTLLIKAVAERLRMNTAWISKINERLRIQ
jgi:O-antigen/teichoic acid export membrane protein